MTIDTLKAHRDDPETLAALLSPEDIAFLIPLLNEQDDTVRYPAFLVLSARSKDQPDVYPYWNVFAEKLDSDNSFQRNIGATLVGLNVRWDEKRLFGTVFSRLMRQCTDEKPITARLTIQTIPGWAEYAPELLGETVAILTGINIMSFRETMRKLVLIDIMEALLAIRAVRPSEAIDVYLTRALTGGLLDKKSIKLFETRVYQ